MINDTDIKNAKQRIEECIKNGEVPRPVEGEAEFFMKKAEQALSTADVLKKISTDTELKKTLKLDDSFETYVWIINAAYYCMFYAATAILAHHGHKIKSELGIHTLTYQAMIYYFIVADNKIEKHILETYGEVEKEAGELMVRQEANEGVAKLKYELKKRKVFTYDMGAAAELSKAETSLERAREFFTLVKEMTGL